MCSKIKGSIFAFEKSGEVALLVEDSHYFGLGGCDAKEDRVRMHEEPPKTGELIMFMPRRRMTADTLRLDRYFAQLPISHFRRR